MNKPPVLPRTPFWVRVRVWLFVWWLSRYRSSIWFGLPACCLGLLVLFAICTFALSAQDREDAYRMAAAQALATKDYETARCYYRRLTLENPQSPDYQFGLAQSLNKLGKTEAAAGLVERLTPLTGKGYVPAHFMLAEQLLSKPKLEADEKRTVEQHLLRIRVLDPNNIQALVMLGEHYLRTDRPQLAEKQFLAAVGSQEQLSLPLARIYQRGQMLQESIRWAERAIAYYRKKAEANHEDSNAHIRWAEAVLVKGDCAPALNILQEAWDLTNDAAYHEPIAQTSVVALDVLSRGKEPRFLDKIAVLKTGLEHGWANPGLIEHLRLLCYPKKEEKAKRTEAVDQLLKARPEWGLLHFLQAIDALQRKNDAEARNAFAKAFTLQPDLDKAANNLAHSLAEGNKIDKSNLQNALELLNYALLFAPQDAQHRMARSQIYLKLGRTQEARKDLDMAQSASP